MSETKKVYRKVYVTVDEGFIYPFIPGTVLDIHVKKGDKIEIGDKLYVLEAMKMKNEVLSPVEGTVKNINVKVGQRVSKNEVILEIG